MTDDESPTAKWLMEYHPELGTCMLETDNPRKKKGRKYWRQKAGDLDMDLRETGKDLDDCVDELRVTKEELRKAKKDLAEHEALLTAEIRGRVDDAAKLREILEIARHWYFDGTTPPPQSASEAMGKILGVIEITPVDNDSVKLQKIKRISDYWGNVINDSSTPNSFECMLQIAKVFRGIDDPTI